MLFPVKPPFPSLPEKLPCGGTGIAGYILAAQTKVVSFGAMDMAETGAEDAAVSFAAMASLSIRPVLSAQQGNCLSAPAPRHVLMDAVRAVG